MKCISSRKGSLRIFCRKYDYKRYKPRAKDCYFDNFLFTNFDYTLEHECLEKF